MVRERALPRWLPLLILAVGAATLVFGWLLGARAANAESDRDTAQAQTSATAGQALDLAAAIRAACDAGTIPLDYQRACTKAVEVQTLPVPAVPAAGPAGATGAAGADGAIGLRGPEGPAGPAGAVGPQGLPGTPGTPGVVGPVGAVGPAGAAGVDGAIGPKGDTGDQGPKGDTGDAGPVGPQGPQGDPGQDAATPDDGTGGGV